MLPLYNNLIYTNLTINEKVRYIKARTLISQLNNLTNKEKNDWGESTLHKMFKDAGNTIKEINKKIEQEKEEK